MAAAFALVFWIGLERVGQQDQQHGDQKENEEAGGASAAQELLLFALLGGGAVELLPQELHSYACACSLSVLLGDNQDILVLRFIFLYRDKHK